jgi:hypothetical protein
VPRVTLLAWPVSPKAPRQNSSSVPNLGTGPDGLFHHLLCINGHGTAAAGIGAPIAGVCALCCLVAAKSYLQK